MPTPPEQQPRRPAHRAPDHPTASDAHSPDAAPLHADGGDDQLEPLSPSGPVELAAVGALEGSSDVATGDPTLLSGRVPDPERAELAGVPGFHGLTPGLAASLITRYTRPGQLVLDLTGDLAVEGVARAGDRRYLRIDTAAAGVLAYARHRGTWAAAALVILRPRTPTTTPLDRRPDTDDHLTRLLHNCRELLDSTGHLIVTTGPGDEPGLGARAVIRRAASARLRLEHHHVIPAGSPAAARPPGNLDRAPSSPKGHVNVLVFAPGGRDDD